MERNGYIEWNRELTLTFLFNLVTKNARPLDMLVDFRTAASSRAVPVRYAVRQVLDQEYEKYIKVRESAARQARYKAGNADDAEIMIPDDKENRQSFTHAEVPQIIKKDFFGRIIRGVLEPIGTNRGERRDGKSVKGDRGMRTWVSFHEGFSNAVRKPITVEEILRGL